MDELLGFVVKFFEQIKDNSAVITTMIICFIICYASLRKNAVKRDLKVDKILEGFNTKLEAQDKSFLAHSEKLDYFVDHFPQFQEASQMIARDQSFISVIDFEIESTADLLNKNFSNGSSVERAINDVENFRATLLESLESNKSLVNRQHYIWLIDVIQVQLFNLVKTLGKLEGDYTLKPKLLNPTIRDLHILINYFVISLNQVYPALTEKQVKLDLESKFEEFGKRRELSIKNFSKEGHSSFNPLV